MTPLTPAVDYMRKVEESYAMHSTRILRLADQEDDCRLFISKKLSGQLEKIVSKIIFPDGHSYCSHPLPIIIKSGMTYEVQYDVEIDRDGMVRFDILIEHTGKALIDLQKSNVIFEIPDIRNIDYDYIVKQFIPDADILQVLME